MNDNSSTATVLNFSQNLQNRNLPIYSRFPGAHRPAATPFLAATTLRKPAPHLSRSEKDAPDRARSPGRCSRRDASAVTGADAADDAASRRVPDRGRARKRGRGKVGRLRVSRKGGLWFWGGWRAGCGGVLTGSIIGLSDNCFSMMNIYIYIQYTVCVFIPF